MEFLHRIIHHVLAVFMVVARYNRKGTLSRYPSLLEGTAGVQYRVPRFPARFASIGGPSPLTFVISTSDIKLLVKKNAVYLTTAGIIKHFLPRSHWFSRRKPGYWEICNVEKGAIFEKLRFSIISLTMKKLPKLDELGIEG
jgi:hypothetical protein